MSETVIKPPPALRKPATLPASKPPAAGAKPARVVKTFNIQPWNNGCEGEKILAYGKSGVGKTTYAAMAPNAVFFGLDDGGRKIKNPLTGEPVRMVPGVEGFSDMRDALHQKGLFPDKATIVIDTVTKLESWMEPYIFENYLQGGKRVTAMRQYGWDGPAHLLDSMRLLLTDLDEHVRRGCNVLLLAQVAPATIANAEGLDYLEDGPKLQHNKQYSVRAEFCEWADHVVRIGYQEFSVARENDKQKAGKVTSDNATRAIFTGGAPHFIAKSRPIDGKRMPPVISFANESDASFWQMMFEGAIPDPA